MFFAASSQASDYYWMNPGVVGDSSWKTIHNWGNSFYVVLGTVPTSSADAAFIYKSKECIIGTDMVGTAKTVAGNVYVGGGIASTNALLTIKGEALFTSLNLGCLAIATNSTGTVKINPGAVVTSPIISIGNTGTNDYSTIGNVNMMGGTMNVNTTLSIGNTIYGNGEMTMNGGTVNCTGTNSALVGNAAAAKGKLTVNNGASFNTLGFFVGNYGTGELILNSGGVVKVAGTGWMHVGRMAGSTGKATINGGVLYVTGTLYIGALTSNANFMQLNNDANVTVGTLLVAVGNATVTDSVGRLTIAGSAAKMKAGAITLGNTLAGTGAATVELQGGTLESTSTLTINNGSTINITGGALILPIDQLAAVNGYINSGKIYNLVEGIKVATTAAQVIVTADVNSIKLDCGAAETEPGYIPLSHTFMYDPYNGFGWVVPPSYIRDRTLPTPLLRDFLYSNNPATFRIDLNPGIYRMTVTMGDYDYSGHELALSVSEPSVILPVCKSYKAQFVTLSVAFEVTQTPLYLYFNSPINNWVVNAMTFEKAQVTQTPELTTERYYIDTWPDVNTWYDPTQVYISRFIQRLQHNPTVTSTGFTSSDYLDLIESNVDFFKTCQDANGAIIDPYDGIERFFSTPCFALAAAVLIEYNGRTDLIEPAAKAMDWSVHSLKIDAAPQGHGDFFPPQIAHALPLLEPYVAPARFQQWKDDISSYDPWTVYTAAPGQGNWNCVAADGEFLYYNLGLRTDLNFIEASIISQGSFFYCDWGLYNSENVPMAYDLFARFWLVDMLANGYDKLKAGELTELMRRGALTSLFMQSPAGELPTGGRSSHHQWNEGLECGLFEFYAKKALNDGDPIMAGVFKRAAHLALKSMQRWVRPTGELWIVKNRADPSLRFGYEGYSMHSAYNLLAMAELAIAYEHAVETDSVLELPTPADLGGFVLDINDFHKVFANASGMYVEIDTSANLAYNPTGLLRIHKKNSNPQIGPSDGIVNGTKAAAVGVEFKDISNNWRRLAEFTNLNVAIEDVNEKPDKVSFTVIYTGSFNGPSSIIEHYILSPTGMQLSVELTDYSDSLRLVWPLLVDDGNQTSLVEQNGSTISVSLREKTNRFTPLNADSVWIDDTLYANRNGRFKLAFAEFSSSVPRIMIEDLMPGDLNNDFLVDVYDLRRFAENWLNASPEAGLLQGDINSDKIIDFKDFALLAQNWLQNIR
jgi:T5SS/PEP-CTERM-associated repeat protein